jgi:predicted DNA-binding transcriptional regulator AlpA
MQGRRSNRFNSRNAAASKTAKAATSARAPVTTPSSDENARAPVAAGDAIRLIYKPELLRLIGVSYSSIFAWMRAGKFPLAREIGPGGQSTRVAWIEAEVLAWLSARPQRRVKPPAGSSAAKAREVRTTT